VEGGENIFPAAQVDLPFLKISAEISIQAIERQLDLHFILSWLGCLLNY
jgi:hypothetical protein